MKVLSVLLVTILTANSCVVDKNWTSLSIYDLLDMADVVVYGLDTGHIERPGVKISAGINNVTDCLFKVYCVLKGNVTMENITIEHISPLSGCSGSINKLNVGMEMIVALKITESGNFKYYEGNALQSSVYETSAENFKTMNSINEVTEWQIPLDGSEDTCLTAIEKVTTTAEDNPELPDDVVAMTTEDNPEPPKDTVTTTTEVNPTLPTQTTFPSSTQAKDTGSKVGANMQGSPNNAGTTGLLKCLYILTLSVFAFIS